MHLISNKNSYAKKITSLCLLSVTLLFVLTSLIAYFQTWYALRSPLIAEDSIKEVAGVHLRIAGFLLICCAVAFIFHKFCKYLVAILISLTSLVIANYFTEWFL